MNLPPDDIATIEVILNVHSEQRFERAVPSSVCRGCPAPEDYAAWPCDAARAAQIAKRAIDLLDGIPS